MIVLAQLEASWGTAWALSWRIAILLVMIIVVGDILIDIGKAIVRWWFKDPSKSRRSRPKADFTFDGRPPGLDKDEVIQ